MFAVVEGEPLDGGQLEALYAVFGGWIVVVAIFAYLFRVILVLVFFFFVVVIILVVVVYPGLDAAGCREGETGVVGELDEAGDGDEVKGAVVVYRKVGEDTDGDVVATVVVEGVCLADDLEVGPLWELVLGWDVAGPPGGRGRGPWPLVVAVWHGGERPARAFPRDSHC